MPLLWPPQHPALFSGADPSGSEEGSLSQTGPIYTAYLLTALPLQGPIMAPLIKRLSLHKAYFKEKNHVSSFLSICNFKLKQC